MPRTVTGLTPQQERAYLERTTEQLARRMAEAVAREIYKTMREVGAAYGNPGKQSEAIGKHRARMTDLLQKHYADIWQRLGQRELRGALKHHLHRIEVKRAVDAIPPTELFDTATRAWIAAHVGEKVTTITNTTEKQAMALIRMATQEAVAEGLGERETAARIAKVLREQGGIVSGTRAQTIARTELHAAAGASTQAAAEVTGLDMVKEWVAAFESERSREDHREIDGQTVGLHERFILPDGEELYYPGDPAGSAGAIINCRCQAVHLVRD
jgi:hypothetical protein